MVSSIVNQEFTTIMQAQSFVQFYQNVYGFSLLMLNCQIKLVNRYFKAKNWQLKVYCYFKLLHH